MLHGVFNMLLSGSPLVLPRGLGCLFLRRNSTQHAQHRILCLSRQGYRHPNGQESLVKYPGVLCGGEAHTVMKVPRLPPGFRALKTMVLSCVISFICVLCFSDVSSVLQKGMRRKDPKAPRASDFATSEFDMKLLMFPVFWRASVRQRWCYSSSFFIFLASQMLCSKVFSFHLFSTFKRLPSPTLRSKIFSSTF